MLFFALISLLPIVSAHGMLWNPSDSTEGAVRGYSKLNTQIDGLRSPVASNADRKPDCGTQVCRGEPSGKATPIKLVNGQDHTLTLSISEAALHQGDCYAYVLDENGKNPVMIASQKDSKACGWKQGENYQRTQSVTNDMVLIKWTFKVENADKIKCKNCILQWKWVATHLAPSYEHFENCADITLDGSAGSGNSSYDNSPSPSASSSTDAPSATAGESPAPSATADESAAPSATSQVLPNASTSASATSAPATNAYAAPTETLEASSSPTPALKRKCRKKIKE